MSDVHYTRCACCSKPIAPRHLMCRRHWRLVPVAQQREVLRTANAVASCAVSSRRSALVQAYTKARVAAVDAVMGDMDHQPKEGLS